MKFPEQLKNFNELDTFLKENQEELGYKEAILTYYKNLGEKLGFSVRKNFSVIKYATNIGKIDLLWVEPNITFTLEFNSLENLLKEFVKIIELSPEIGVLILSSKSSCKVRDVEKFIEESIILEKTRKEKMVILDIAEKKVISF